MANPLLQAAGLLHYPDAAMLGERSAISDFYDETAHVSLEGMQELYTMTFDLNPVATLEAGWHIWGEQYERGRFLADLRERQEAMGLGSGSELPDHLTVLLPMLAVTRDPKLAAHVAAALAKIQTPLDEQGNPYRHVIRAASAAVATLNGQKDEEAE